MNNNNSGAIDNNDQADNGDALVGGNALGNVIITGNNNKVNVGKSETVEKPAAKKKRSRAARKKKSITKKPNTQIIVALIGAIGLIIAAWLGSPILERLRPTPAPSPTSTAVVSESPTLLSATLESETPTLAPVTLESETPLPTITSSPPQDAADEKMTVMFFGNPLDGKAPLRVNFNARESFVTLPDGSTIACGTTRLCHYTFTVLLDGNQIETDANTDGLYSYNFGKRGQYVVTVTVCRDEVCSGSRVMVNVR